MRILMVWITALVLIMFITIGWYIGNILVTQIASGNTAYLGDVGSRGYNLVRLLEYVSIAWGPVFILFVLLWAIASSASQYALSEVYR
jgi:Ni,Fe-hydrogenase I cytochrome b subunit